MAKNFPYFKFFPTEWMTGDIVFEELEIQGLFINICALYWQRNADLTVDDINKRFKKSDLLAKLTDRFISVSDNKISIKFLDEQLEDANHISKRNSENGAKGGRPKALKTLEEKPTANRPLTESKAKKSKEEKEEEENKLISYIKNNFPTVCKLTLPTNEQAELLTSTYKSDAIIKTLTAMESKKDLLKKYKSSYLTLKTWLDRDSGSLKENIGLVNGETLEQKKAREVAEREKAWKERGN